MGCIADMILEGFLSEDTGEVIDGDAPGYPRRMNDQPEVRQSQYKKTKKPYLKANFKVVRKSKSNNRRRPVVFQSKQSAMRFASEKSMNFPDQKIRVYQINHKVRKGKRITLLKNYNWQK